MKKYLFIFGAIATLGVAAPANAQVYFGADPGGAGVQVGPFGIGVGPDYWGYHHRYEYGPYAQSGECRLIRSRVETPSGRIVIRTRRICD